MLKFLQLIFVVLQIIEEPASTKKRFRYESEIGWSAAIPGVSSTKNKKTYPTIQVFGLENGVRAMAVVSCVTADYPHKVHPHRLVRKNGCQNGVCYMEFPLAEPRCIRFDNLGILCVKKENIGKSLQERQEIYVDPFHFGYDALTFNQKAIRLCFQVFVQNVHDWNQAFTLEVTNPVVSAVIYDLKCIRPLVIEQLSHFADSVFGGLDMELHCKKFYPREVSVRFYEMANGVCTWEAIGMPTGFWNSIISVRVPPYKDTSVRHNIKCFIELRCIHSGETSQPRQFEYYALQPHYFPELNQSSSPAVLSTADFSDHPNPFDEDLWTLIQEIIQDQK